MDELRGAAAVIAVGTGNALHGDRVLPVAVDADPALVLEWLAKRVRWGSDRVACVSLTSDPAPAAIIDAIDDHMRRGAIDQNSVVAQSMWWAKHFCETLKREPRWACNAVAQWAGRPVFIVGAGMGLQRNGHLLAECQKRGPIVAVNSSVGACLRWGVTPDLVVCLEGLDLSAHLAPLRDLNVPVALDVFSSPANWAASTNTLAIAHHESSIVPHLVHLGVCPTPYLASSTCAAAALAIAWDASELILVGQDNATHGGRAYADGSPFAELSATVEDGTLQYSGACKHAYDMAVVWRPGWRGGAAVASDNTFDHVIRWHSLAARDTTITNATEQGAAIPETFERELADVVASLPLAPRWTLGEVPTTSTTATIAALVDAARHVLETKPPCAPRDFSVGLLWTSAAALSVPPHQRGEAQKRAIIEAATKVLEYLT